MPSYRDILQLQMYSYVTKVVTESVYTLEDFIDASMDHGKPTTLVVLSSAAHRPAFA